MGILSFFKSLFRNKKSFQKTMMILTGMLTKRLLQRIPYALFMNVGNC